MSKYQVIDWYFISCFLNILNCSLLFIRICMFSLFYYRLICDNLLVMKLFTLLECFAYLCRGFLLILLVSSFISILLIVLLIFYGRIYLKGLFVIGYSLKFNCLKYGSFLYSFALFIYI